jgi:alpha-glucosidase
MYFVAGTNESATMVSNINTVKNNLIAKGLFTANTFTKFDSYGTHTESYWRGEFGALYQWLFQNENLAIATSSYESPKIIQTLSGKIVVEGIPSATDFVLYDLWGKQIKTITLSNGTYQFLEELSGGIYILKSINNEIEAIKLVRN